MYSGMDNPTRLKENLKTLAEDMQALVDLRNMVARKRPDQMDEWLQRVNREKCQVDLIDQEGSQSNNFAAKIRLNQKVIKSLKALRQLREEGNASLQNVSPYLHELMEDKPRKFSHDDLRSFTSNWSSENKIASDGFGVVYKGQLIDGRHVSVKVLEEKDVAEEIFMSEITTMGKTKHQYVVKLYGFCFSESMKAVVYEYFENESLDKFLYEGSNSLPWDRLYRISIDTAKGLSYLHEGIDKRIIHHDVKASNVLLNSNFSPKLTDFGLAKLSNKDVSHVTLTRTRGSPGYAAPEMWIPASPITEKCDVYSFGMMLFEVFGRRRNLDSIGKTWFPKQVWEKFKSEELDQLIDECAIIEKDKENATVLVAVALWCFQREPKSRPSMSTVVKMLEKEMHVGRPPNPHFSPPK